MSASHAQIPYVSVIEHLLDATTAEPLSSGHGTDATFLTYADANVDLRSLTSTDLVADADVTKHHNNHSLY